MNGIRWEELLPHLEGAPFKVKVSEACPDHRGLCMAHKPLPVSLSEAEADYLYQFIRRHKLKCGLDLATGFGISALAMGFAMHEQEGSVLSIDSYAEEVSQQQQTGAGVVAYAATDGYRFARWLVSRFVVLSSTVELQVGCYPMVLARWWRKICDHGGFDVVFLDCPKNDDDFANCLLAINKLLATRFTIFVHDTHTMTRPAEIARELLGLPMVNVLPQQRFPFMRISNIPNLEEV